ncbi:MAG TPA: glycosyltransferase [Lachnospiraceae bacterium]|nr:glycosyltransferase [Lachnospiraceae bacterium]
MISISICMIVKNEERTLKRCLDSVYDLVEEIIVVDTGSTDATMQIASEYHHVKLYQFPWVEDFSAARNYAFSMATQEYIYSVDADEVLDQANRKEFLLLKQTLLPEIEIVQMKYGNQLQFGTVYNFNEEYRPKLFRRVRQFIWEAPIHETIRITPVIYNSEIVITHMPEVSHASRDIAAFQRLIRKGERLSKRLQNMYAKELFISGTDADIIQAGTYFKEACEDIQRDMDEIMEACLVTSASARRNKDIEEFFKYAMKVMASGGCSEICHELGDYYLGRGDYKEASLWYYNACYETQAVLSTKVQGKGTLLKLAECYEKMGLPEDAMTYLKEAENKQ